MTEELWKNSAIIAKRNVDSNQTPISVNLTELKQIIDVHSCLVLNQLPDEHYGIDIDGFTEVYDIEDVTTRSYKVDYANGVLYFHPNNIGKMLQVNYYGVGCTLLSASRIYTKYDKYGNVLETLEELLDKGKLYIQAIDALGGAVEVINRVENANATGTVLHENLLEDIEIGSELNKDLINNNHIAENTITTLIQKTETGNQTINNLTDKTNLANQKKQELEVTTSNANNKNTELNNTISTANNTDTKLKDTILSGQDSINKINATGNKSLIIGASQFINNEYTWKHDMNSEDLHVTFEDLATKLPLQPDYQRIDKNNILIRNSAEHPNIKVVLSASYYQGNALFGTNVEEFASDSIGVNTKKVRLKDGNGIVENPVTDSDAVFMPDGTTKLTKKIDDINKRINENTIEIGNIINEKNKKDFFNIIKNSKSKLIGHRGLGHIYPENTAFAVEKAFEIGMFGVEVDIYQTRDGEFVIIHDDTLDRTTNGTGSVENLNYDYISSLKIDGGNGNPSYYTDLKIPKIEDLLKILQRYNKYLFLELKGTIYNYDKLFAIMDKYKVRDKVVFLSFNYTLLSEIRNKDKNIMLGYNANISNSNIDNCIVLGNSFISTPTSYVTEDLIKYAHNNNVAIISYSATSIMQFRDQMDLGVDLMTTDFLIEGGDF
ncbi:glycerophosphodiester phosphodiesterase family protein [Clostridium sp.]|uniref:glycerophosphodiester phosphodiesterase n=1 Tax=Clostridium sp. TaxID=1506 RepID=UPI001DC17C31|nr:glycerophosphodiester phosphodiesterase family protein [Clostridium sp.]MBS5307798.1 hypothetical protein [Clostridium sp.]